MDYLNAFTFGVSMSVDAMCASISAGLKDNKMSKAKTVLIPLTFGIYQYVMPTIGYFACYVLKDTLVSYIGYIAFAVLLLLGIKSLVDFIKDYKAGDEEVKEAKIGFWELQLIGIATSIDALTIGFVNINLSIGDAMLTFGIIGLTTFVLSLISLLLGKAVGKYVKKWAPLFSAIIFIALAIKFLVEAII